MKRKKVGILVIMLMTAIAVIPAIGTMNEINNIEKSEILSPMVEWEKTFGGEEFDHFRSIQQTNDGGYIAFGSSEEDDMNYAWLLKIDSNGIEEWNVINNNINGTQFDVEDLMNCVIQTSDGGYICGGFSRYYYDAFGAWASSGFLWKVDSIGETEWLQWYYDLERILWIVPFAIEEISDGFVCSGMTVQITNLETGEHTLDFVLMKTDLAGNRLWYKTYDVGGFEVSNSLCITDDGGYFLSGEANTNENIADGAYYMVKTDSNGNMIWDSIFDGPKYEYSPTRGCQQTNDGGYIQCGITKSYGLGGTDIWIIKTDSSGNMMWNKTYGDTKDDHCYGMDSTEDGGYIFAIIKDRFSFGGTKDDTWIIKIDEDGNSEWKYLIEEDGIQIPTYIVQTYDGGYIIGGRTGRADSKSSDGYIVKISSFDNQRPGKPGKPIGPSNGKPDTEYTFSTNAVTDPDGDSLQYLWDWGDGNYSELLDSTETTYTWTTENKFEVRVMAVDENGGESDWSEPLTFSTPRNMCFYQNIILKLIERYPLLAFLF